MSTIKEILMERFPDMEETPRKVISSALTNGVVIGSVAWGVATGDSDIDILIPPGTDLTWKFVFQEYNAVYLHAEEEEAEQWHYFHDGTKSCYVLYGDKIYNLIFAVTVEDFNRWKYATDKMAFMAEKYTDFKDKIKDRECRIDCFIKCKEIYDKNPYTKEKE